MSERDSDPNDDVREMRFEGTEITSFAQRGGAFLSTGRVVPKEGPNSMSKGSESESSSASLRHALARDDVPTVIAIAVLAFVVADPGH